MVMYLHFGPLILVKLCFGPYFGKLLFVPKFRRLNLVFFYALKYFIFVILSCFFSIFRIFVVDSLNDPQ
jgi:hypothetical protein